MTLHRARSAIRAAANLLAVSEQGVRQGTAKELLEQDVAELRGAATYLEQKLGLSRERMAGIQLETLRELRRRDVDG
jgi:hypothetical protein